MDIDCRTSSESEFSSDESSGFSIRTARHGIQISERREAEIVTELSLYLYFSNRGLEPFEFG